MPAPSADQLATARAAPALPPRRLVATWALAIGGLAAARVLALVEPTGLLLANLGGVAAFLFIWLADRALRRRGEDWPDYGAPLFGLSDGRTWRAFGRGALQGAVACALVFPPFFLGYRAFVTALPSLPPGLAAWLAPYLGRPEFHLRWPDGLLLQAAVQVLVVALPEELFYRGWLQTAWARTAPEAGVTVLGARLGRGFLATQALFALGHLVTLQPWRLATFFPGLLFGWLRARTGSIAASVLVHAGSNLFMLTLERSFYG